MTFEEFERHARAEWERIPAEYRAGVDGLLIERPAVPHPGLPDIYTLGECITESYPSDFGGPDTTRSMVVLHYGSFFRLSRLDPEFDWDAEIWDTLTHEVQHHLESLASEDALVDMDYAADENYRRYQGEPFDPWFFRSGLPEDGWLRVEDEYFQEHAAVESRDTVEFDWQTERYAVTAPAGDYDVAFLTVTDLPVGTPALHIVLVRRHGLLRRLGSLLRPQQPLVLEQEVAARAAGAES